MTANQTYFALLGGLDQESAAIAVPPGRAIAVLNHEAVSRGYQRTQGYERYDGRPRPSAATFHIATFIDGSAAFTAGDTITGFSSGATARVLANGVLDSGTYVGGDAAGSVALHLIDGTFESGEAMRVGGITRAILETIPTQGDGAENATYRAYLTAAQEYARSLIEEVPGEGPVRGILWFEGKAHSWRDNVGATAGVLHQSTAAGWMATDLGTRLLFEGGSSEIEIGDDITGSGSGATATVRYVALNAGTDWSDGDAAGTLILDDVTGTFVDGDGIQVGASTMAIASGGSAAASFPAGGRYEFEIFNFYGSTGYERAYGANGVGQAFEYDGSSIVSINTGMPDDKPFLIAAHKNHLFLGFEKGSLQHSDLGEPRSFTAILGAAELGMGHELTGLVPNATSTLLVTTDSSISVLTGNDSSDWLLEGLADDAGAKRFSQQRIGNIIYLDERGVRSASATQTYGNFKLGTFTSLIQKELDAKRQRGAKPVASCIVKAKDQYLLFFDDGTGISIYFGRKNPEPMLFEYPFIVSCINVAEVDGVERVFVGAEDGFVYELNVGTSFDGAEIEAFAQLPFGHQGGPRILKRYHKAVAELIAGPDTSLAMIAQFDYGSGLQPYAHSDIFGIEGSGGVWGVSNWASFFWSAPTVAQAESYIQGLGANMSLIVYSKSAIMESYILQGMTVMFSPRGQKR